MFGGIALIILGIIVIGFTFYLYFAKKVKADDTFVIIILFAIGAGFFYGGFDKIDKYNNPRENQTIERAN